MSDGYRPIRYYHDLVKKGSLSSPNFLVLNLLSKLFPPYTVSPVGLLLTSLDLIAALPVCPNFRFYIHLEFIILPSRSSYAFKLCSSMDSLLCLYSGRLSLGDYISSVSFYLSIRIFMFTLIAFRYPFLESTYFSTDLYFPSTVNTSKAFCTSDF